MAKIRPFPCMRPNKEYVAKVAALPYDVYHLAEAKEVVEKEPMSFLKIDLPETQFADDFDPNSPEAFAKAKELLEQDVEAGIYEKKDTPVYYLYEQVMNGRSQVGLVACSSVDDYRNNVIKKHENTRADKEYNRIQHVDVCSCQTGPIFLTYRKNPVIAEITEKTVKTTPLYDFTAEDGVIHRVWEISNETDIRTITEAFATIPSVYIADGHHRAASAVKVSLKRREEHPDYTGEEEFNFFLSVLFPDEELMIMDYNRTVKDLNGLTEEEYMEKVKEIFRVEPLEHAKSPEKKGEVTMYLNHAWYRLTADPAYYEGRDASKRLDVSILQDYLLEPVLGIQDPKTDQRIDFIGGIRGLKELEKRGDEDMKVSFAMYPTSIAELMEVADQGLLMPPKSTWFEPKLRSGIFLHPIER